MKEERGLDFSQIPILDGRQVNPFQSKIAQVAQAPTLATPKYVGDVEGTGNWTPMTEEDWKTYYKNERENEPILLQNVSNSLGGLGRGIGNSLSRVGNSLYDFGKDIVKGVKNIDTDKMPTLGDLISMYGAYKAGHDPYELTMQQRAGDTPNINPYENYGQRGLNKMEETKLNLQNNLDQAIQNNQLNSNAMRSNANANTRSINTARAMGLAIDAQQRQADNQAYSQYGNQIANINGRIAGMLDQQDRMVMSGNQMRDDNDRRDRDNFYTQLQKDIETRNKSTQYTGAYLNKIKERDYKQNLVNESSEIFSIGSDGKLKAKRGVEYTPEQKPFLGAYAGAFEDWDKAVAEKGYERIGDKFYNENGQEVDIKTKGFPVIKGGSKVETSVMKGKKMILDNFIERYEDQLPKDITREEAEKFMNHLASDKAYEDFMFSDGTTSNGEKFDIKKYKGMNYADYTRQDGTDFKDDNDFIRYNKAGRSPLKKITYDDAFEPYKVGDNNTEKISVVVGKSTKKVKDKDGKVKNVTSNVTDDVEIHYSEINRQLKPLSIEYYKKYNKKFNLNDPDVIKFLNDKLDTDMLKSKKDVLLYLSGYKQFIK